jgi:Flp pilus assembly protein TadG
MTPTLMKPRKTLARRSMKSVITLGRCTTGTALLETIIVLPLLLIVMIGVVDYSWSLSMQATASKSMRGAARYLSLLPGAAACSTWAKVYAQNLAVYGNVLGSGTPLVPGWTADDTHVPITDDCAATSNCPTYFQVSGSIPLSTVIAALIPVPVTLTLSSQHYERPTPYVGDTSACS